MPPRIAGSGVALVVTVKVLLTPPVAQVWIVIVPKRTSLTPPVCTPGRRRRLAQRLDRRSCWRQSRRKGRATLLSDQKSALAEVVVRKLPRRRGRRHA